MPRAKASAAAGGRAVGGNGTVNHRGAHDEILRGKTAGKVAGAIRAGKIEERGPAFDPLGGKPRKVDGVAVGGADVGKARSAHRLRGALADRKYR